MGLCASWSNSYLQNCIKPPNLDRQTFNTLISTTVICAQNLYKTLIKLTVPCEVYKSMYVE